MSKKGSHNLKLTQTIIKEYPVDPNKILRLAVRNHDDKVVDIHSLQTVVYASPKMYKNVCMLSNMQKTDHLYGTMMSNREDRSIIVDDGIKHFIRNWLVKYPDLFAVEHEDLRHTTLILHDIVIKENSKPIRMRPYPLRPGENEVMRTILDKYLKQKVIDYSSSPRTVLAS